MKRSVSEGRVASVSAILQVRAVRQATRVTNRLVFATWGLVLATVVVAIVAIGPAEHRLVRVPQAFPRPVAKPPPLDAMSATRAGWPSYETALGDTRRHALL